MLALALPLVLWTWVWVWVWVQRWCLVTATTGLRCGTTVDTTM